MVGTVRGTCDLGGSHLEAPREAGFLAWFGADGAAAGARTFTSGRPSHTTIAAAPGGDWIVAGYFAGRSPADELESLPDELESLRKELESLPDELESLRKELESLPDEVKAQALATYTEEQEALANHAVIGHLNAVSSDIEHLAQRNPQIAGRYEKVLAVVAQRRDAIAVGIARAKASKAGELKKG